MNVNNYIMCPVKLINNIRTGSSISLPIVNKQFRLREAYADKMSAKFQKLVLDNPNDNIAIKDYKNYLAKVLGTKKVSVNFMQLSTKGINASISPEVRLYRLKGQYDKLFVDYIGYKMEVEKQKGKLCCSKSTLVHETRHLFDMLCNPKYKMARHYKNIDDSEVITQYTNIKNYVISPEEYSPKRVLGVKIPSFEENLRKKIEGLKNTEIIDILQICRYHLKSEQNAYADAHKFNLKLYPKTFKTLLAVIKQHFDNIREFQFFEKERVLKKIIREFIEKERKGF